MPPATSLREQHRAGGSIGSARLALQRDLPVLPELPLNVGHVMHGWPAANGTSLAGALADLKRCMDLLRSGERRHAVQGKASFASLRAPVGRAWPEDDSDATDPAWDTMASDEVDEIDETEAVDGEIPAQESELQLPPPAAGTVPASLASSLNIYLAEVRALPTLSPAEERAVALRVRAGDEQAAAEMVRAHLGLVVAVARSMRTPNMPLEDLIGDGNMGLLEAVSRFDPDRGVLFGTYARFWIKQSIRQGILNHSRTVRLPVHVIRDVTRLLREQRKGRPAADGHAAATSRSGEPSELMRLSTATGKTVDEVVQLMGHAQVPLSMDLPVGGEDSLVLADTIEDTERGTPESKLVSDQMLDTLLACVNSLSRIERVIVLRRYGFETGEPDTLENVGSLLGLTAERVRQIQKAALPKLREALLEKGLDASALFG